MQKFRAILSREFFSTLRSGWAMFSLGLILTVVSVAFCAMWAMQSSSWDFYSRAMLSRSIFYAISISLFCMLGVVSPIMTASAICRERETKTLDLLLCTGIPRLTVLISKWIAAVGFQVMLIMLLLPLLALSFQLGGIGLDEYLFSFFLIVQAIMVYGMLGLAVSCWTQRSAPAMMTAIVLVLGITVGWPLLLVLIGEMLKLRGIYGVWQKPDTLAFSISPVYAGTVLINILAGRTAFSFANTISSLRPHLTAQSIIFFLSLLLAFRGLHRARTPRSATAGKLIDDPGVLRKRSRRFPYYLIDPLKRAQDIGDRQNPAYEREIRTGGLARTTTLIRVGYVGAFISIFFGFAFMDNDTAESLRNIFMSDLCFLMIFIPILSATSISREREENTLDLLRITLLEPRRIVRGKFFSSLRYLMWFFAGITFLPVFIHGLFSFIAPGTFRADSLATWADVLCKLIPLCISYCALYASVGVLMSSMCRRNILAILLTYLLIGIMLGLPGMFWIGGKLYESAKNVHWFPQWVFIMWDDIAAPLLKTPHAFIQMLSAPWWLTLDDNSRGLPKWVGRPDGYIWAYGAVAFNVLLCTLILRLSGFYLKRIGTR